jgi:hypothetical protein
MATFYLSNPEHESERKVKVFLQDQLGNKWHVFQGIEMNRFRGDGEIDFLVVHESLGAIVLEVKGGKIQTREENGKLEWSSTNINGRKIIIQNPYEQSSRQGWKLKQYIKDTIGQDLHQSNAVAFPDIPELNISSPDINSLNTFGYNKLANNLEFGLLKLLQNVQANTLSFDILKTFLMPEIDTKISYQSNLDLLDTELYKLTEEQYEAMQGLEENSKLYVKGPAGTGKTILASKFVKSLLKKNKNVIFACHTKMLGKQLEEEFASHQEDSSGELLLVGNIFSILRKIHNTLEEKAPSFNSEKIREYESFKSDYDNFIKKNSLLEMKSFSNKINLKTTFELSNLYRCLDLLDINLDAIVIDECQDFQPEWLKLLQENLYNAESKFYMFGDPSQSLIEDWKPIFKEPVKILTRNLRNSDEINIYINKLFNKETKNSGISSNFKVNETILKEESNQDQLKIIHKQLPKLLHHLKEKNISNHQIVILTLDASKISRIRNIKALGKTIGEIQDITVESASRFKGVESDIIIALFPDSKKTNEQRRLSAIYTGLTRPKSLLYVFIGKSNLSLIQNAVKIK